MGNLCAAESVRPLAWRLQTDMTGVSPIEVVQEAVDLTGMTEVPMVDRAALLTYHGAGYLSRAFVEYLGLVGLRHIVAFLSTLAPASRME
jgi:hypothetical protein